MLIDAVIGWENLFGTGSGEVTLRVSTAMAWLLERTPESRQQRQKETKEIYGRRSKVVHGVEVESADAYPLSARARELLLQALRELYRSRPDLIGKKDRSERLLLGL